MRKSITITCCCLLMLMTSVKAQNFKPIFNGKNLDGWYLYLQDKRGSNRDSAFLVKDSMLYVTGKSVGYLCTNVPYKNFHLVIEFKWGQKKYPPRLNEKRDSGILYYFSSGSPDKIWPRSFECQIQEGDCGDFWLADSIAITANNKRFMKQRIPKISDHEKPHGEWNTMEVIAVNGKCTHIVNGVVVNEGTEANVREGRIALQTEAAEMYFKNIRLAVL
ncbi:MAG: DUF1080 domain-containing protein [Chitinophagaceae bacterium]